MIPNERSAVVAVALAMACGGSPPAGDDTAGSDEAAATECRMDYECCGYTCRSEAFWATYNNSCTCATSTIERTEPTAECVYDGSSCTFVE